MRDFRQQRPPRRSAFAPFAFMLSVLLLAAAAALALVPQADSFAVTFAEERPGALRIQAVRDLVRSGLGGAIDRPANPSGTSRNFVVERGETVASVARRLAAEGVITRPAVLLLAFYDAGREESIQAGTYRVSAALPPAEIVRLFERAAGEQLVLRVIDGWRLRETAAEVQRRFPRISADDFLAAAVAGRYDQPVLRDLKPGTALEGFLFPDTYFFGADVTSEEIVRTLLETFQRRVGTRLIEAAEARKRTVYEIVIVASIVEREARVRSESPTIAAVYWNRLARGIALEADPTVQYALGDWREPSVEDLKIDSPYNTYKRPGLPPAPICSPGEAALQGAASPGTAEFLFFVARNDGSGEHAFARTLEEHEANRVRYGNR